MMACPHCGSVYFFIAATLHTSLSVACTDDGDSLVYDEQQHASVWHEIQCQDCATVSTQVDAASAFAHRAGRPAPASGTVCEGGDRTPSSTAPSQ
jgi:hypothetical protein